MFRIKTIFTAGMFALGTLVAAPAALASCAAQPEVGSWQNTDAATRGITRASLRFVCQDQILNGRPYPPGAPWYVQLWGSCSPNDCAWNEIPARRLDNGWIFGRIDQGFAKREIWAKMSGGRMRVYIRTDFVDPSRSDYNSDAYFVR